jgi:hypothetical protein
MLGIFGRGGRCSILLLGGRVFRGKSSGLFGGGIQGLKLLGLLCGEEGKFGSQWSGVP